MVFSSVADLCPSGHDTRTLGRYRDGSCAECRRQRTRAWYRANKGRARATNNAWRQKNRDKTRAYNRKTYGGVDAPGELRTGPCGNTACTYVGPLEWDHDHTTGRERGWLCGPCNRALGQARDSADILVGLTAYLRASRPDGFSAGLARASESPPPETAPVSTLSLG